MIPQWIKPAAYGAVVGAVALAIIGFSWGGWVTGGTASQLAREKAQTAVVAALVPICFEQAQNDPLYAERMVSLQAESSWKRDDTLADLGWATMPGAQKPLYGVADACAKTLIESLKKAQ